MVLPRTFDFATGLMVKDVRRYLDEAQALGLPRQLTDTCRQVGVDTLPEQDFTSIVKGVGESRRRRRGGAQKKSLKNSCRESHRLSKMPLLAAPPKKTALIQASKPLMSVSEMST